MSAPRLSEPPRPYHHGDLRRVLVDTAMAMLIASGGWQFTMREVARRAGVSHGAPYRHFIDRTDLLAELALIGFDGLREDLRAVAPGDADHVGSSAFITLARAYLGFAAARPALYRLMFSREIVSTAVYDSDRALAACTILTDALEHGQALGAVRHRAPKLQMAACWAQIHGLALLSIDGLLTPEEIAPASLVDAVAVLLEGLLQD